MGTGTGTIWLAFLLPACNFLAGRLPEGDGLHGRAAEGVKWSGRVAANASSPAALENSVPLHTRRMPALVLQKERPRQGLVATLSRGART